MGKYNDQLKNKQFRKAKKHDTDNGSVIEVAQDVTDIVEKNKQEYNQASTSWGNEIFDNKELFIFLYTDTFKVFAITTYQFYMILSILDKLIKHA